MSAYKYQGDRENIDVTKMIALNSHCNSVIHKNYYRFQWTDSRQLFLLQN